MSRKKRVDITIPTLLVFVLAALWFWYSRPVPLSHLAPWLETEAPAQIRVELRQFSGPDGVPVQETLTLTPEDPDAQAFLQLLLELRFRRNVENLVTAILPASPSIQGEGDLSWQVSLERSNSFFRLQYTAGRFSYSDSGGRGRVFRADPLSSGPTDNITAFLLERCGVMPADSGAAPT